MVAVIVSREAIEDIVRIGEHIAKQNPTRALSFTAELYDKCRSLGEMPEAYERLGFRSSPDIRRRVYGQYIIFYAVMAERLEVLHVLHGAQDYKKLLSAKK